MLTQRKGPLGPSPPGAHGRDRSGGAVAVAVLGVWCLPLLVSASLQPWCCGALALMLSKWLEMP